MTAPKMSDQSADFQRSHVFINFNSRGWTSKDGLCSEYYCVLCPDETQPLGYGSITNSSHGKSNFQSHLRSKTHNDAPLASLARCPVHRKKIDDLKAAIRERERLDVELKRAREGAAPDTPAKVRKALTQTTLKTETRRRATDDEMVALFCSSPIPFYLLDHPVLKYCFNTELTGDELKKLCVTKGRESVPSDITDASAFCDLCKIHDEWISFGIHCPVKKIHCTAQCTVLKEGKTTDDLEVVLQTFLDRMKELRNDIIAMTADNATNVQGLEKMLAKHNIWELPCWPHTTQLLVGDLEDTEFWRGQLETIEALCQRMEEVRKVSLPQIGVTRWWSRYERCASALAKDNEHSFFTGAEKQSLVAYLLGFLAFRIFGKVCEASGTTALECINGFYAVYSESASTAQLQAEVQRFCRARFYRQLNTDVFGALVCLSPTLRWTSYPEKFPLCRDIVKRVAEFYFAKASRRTNIPSGYSVEQLDSQIDRFFKGDRPAHLWNNDFWKSDTAFKDFTILWRLRIALNGIHFSESHCERNFGHHKHVINKKRSNLSDEVIQGMMQFYYNHPGRKQTREDDRAMGPAIHQSVQLQGAAQLKELLMVKTDVCERDFNIWWDMYNMCLKLEKLRGKKKFTIDGKEYKIVGTDFKSVDSTVTLEAAGKQRTHKAFTEQFYNWLPDNF